MVKSYQHRGNVTKILLGLFAAVWEYPIRTLPSGSLTSVKMCVLTFKAEVYCIFKNNAALLHVSLLKGSFLPINYPSGEILFRCGATDYGLPQGQSSRFFSFIHPLGCPCKTGLWNSAEAFQFEFDDASKIGLGEGGVAVRKWDSACLRLALRQSVRLHSQFH